MIENAINNRVEISLDELLEYRNQDVVDAFTATYELSGDEAEKIFVEMIRFLWLCETATSPALRVIDRPIAVIDEMWHTFILFTKPYHHFCHKYFGHYIHHVPTTEQEKREAKKNRTKEERDKYINTKRDRYNQIYDILGRETFITWYHRFPELYSPERLREIRKKH